MLDAGRGTGRVAVELTRRGVEAVGARSCLPRPGARSSGVGWVGGDLADATVADGGAGGGPLRGGDGWQRDDLS